MKTSSLSPSPELNVTRLKIKKLLTYITLVVFFLCGGIEYSVILPTCWDFMRTRFDAKQWLYGLTLAAMSMTNLFIGPVMGSLYDHTHQPKVLVVSVLLFQIGGNFMYFAATSKYMVLGSRFISGVGLSGGAVLFGELARITTKRERTSVFSMFMSTRQFGLVAGPAFNLFLSICDFRIGPFLVDKYTAPALFMMIVFSLLAVMFVFMFFKLPTAVESNEGTKEDINDSQVDVSIKSPIIASTGNEISVEVHHGRGAFVYPPSISASETSSILSPSPHMDETKSTSSDKIVDSPPRGSYGTINSSDPTTPTSTTPSPKHFHVSVYNITSRSLSHFNMLLREDIVVLLTMVMFGFISQLILETGLVPFVENEFNWEEFQTSLFYSAAGIEIILVFILTSILSKRLTDKYLILIGLILEIVANIWYLVMFGSGGKSGWMIEKFVVGTFICLFGMPFFIVGASSLYSKLLHPNIQGFGQGIRRSVISIASIMGPLWAGASFDLDDTFGYYPFFGVSLLFFCIIMVMFVLSFSKLKEPKYSKLNSK